MKPSIGRNVHVLNYNGSLQLMAAVITAIPEGKGHDPADGTHAIVSLTVFPDGQQPGTARYVPMFDNEAQAIKYLDWCDKRHPPVVCFWPERV